VTVQTIYMTRENFETMGLDCIVSIVGADVEFTFAFSMDDALLRNRPDVLVARRKYATMIVQADYEKWKASKQ
jgi:hypothetical protein